MKVHQLTVLGLCSLGCLIAASGCSTSAEEAAPGKAAQTLGACGLPNLTVDGVPQRIEGDERQCFLALGPEERLKLTKDPDDLGLMGPTLVSERENVRVYEGRGTSLNSKLYGASMAVAGYYCVVQGFDTADAAARAVASCSRIGGKRP